MTAEEDIAVHLAAKGRGTLASTIFVNDKPASPDAVICIFGYAGQAPEWTNTNKYDQPSVQVQVRGAKNGAGAARTLIENIYKDLDGVTNTTINGTYYQRIEAAQSGPNPMGKDELGRTEYVWNFYTSKTR